MDEESEDYESLSYYDQLQQYLSGLLRAQSLQDRTEQSSSPGQVASLYSENSKKTDSILILSRMKFENHLKIFQKSSLSTHLHFFRKKKGLCIF